MARQIFILILGKTNFSQVEIKYAFITKWLFNCRSTVQSQKPVSTYFTSKQIQPIGFAEQRFHSHVQWRLLTHRYCPYCSLPVNNRHCLRFGTSSIIAASQLSQLSALITLTSFAGGFYTRHWTIGVWMLVHRLRRWPNTQPALVHRVFRVACLSYQWVSWERGTGDTSEVWYESSSSQVQGGQGH